MSTKNKSVSLHWEMNSILMQILPKIFFCIDHQHGRLVTWCQTKNTVTDRDSILKHISKKLARRPNKCITLPRTNLSNTGNYPCDSDIPIIKLIPGLHVGSPCNYKGVYTRVQRQREKGGERGRVWWGDLTQPPANFSKFLVFLAKCARE